MRYWAIPFAFGLGIGLAVLIGQRMSTDAMAVVIGVAVGVCAGVPTSLILSAIMMRRTGWRQEPPAVPQVPQTPQMPPIAIIRSDDLVHTLGYNVQSPWVEPRPDQEVRPQGIRIVGR